jgi:Zn-dependent protease
MSEPHDDTESGSLLAPSEPPAPLLRALPFALFALTVLSTTLVPMYFNGDSLSRALTFSVPLMAILLAHEFGHYIAARIHRVPASLPYFVPLPLPPLGTMGAVILMPGEIKSRNALLDIGAAGPLAGLVVALPVLCYGIATSPVERLPDAAYTAEGHSLLYAALLYFFKGPIPAGHDIMLSPTAFAGWAGLLVTMLNLIPSLQLDGGHVAHALLGDRQERISVVVRRSIFAIGIAVTLYFGITALGRGLDLTEWWAVTSVGLQWLVWAGLLHWMAGRSEREHPATDDEPLSPTRRWIARFTLALFVVLFMPAWLRTVIP